MSRNKLLILALIPIAAFTIWYAVGTEQKKSELPQTSAAVPEKMRSKQPKANGSSFNSSTAPLPGQPSEPELSPRDQKVQAGLKEFIARTAHITKESIEREQERVKKGLEAANNIVVEAPKTETVTDQDGYRWEKLQYSNGTIRYIPISPSNGNEAGEQN